MLSSTQRAKLRRQYGWDKLRPSQKADFNYDMRKKLEGGLRDLTDMALLMQTLPEGVLKNINSIDYLQKVIEFVDIFLEKAAPLPVGEHESGELRVFQNFAWRMEDHPNVDDWERNGYVRIIDGKKYMVKSDSWTASPGEIHRCEILKKHIENIQKYIDPSIAVAMDWQPRDALSVDRELRKRADMMGPCQADFRTIKDAIPTKPPCKPRIIVEGETTEEAKEET